MTLKKMKPMPLNVDFLSKRKYKVLIEEHKFQNFFFIDLYVKLFIYDIKEAYGSNVRSNFFEFRGDYMRWAVDLKAFDEMALHYLKLVQNNQEFAVGVNAKLFTALDAANKYARELLKWNFTGKTNAELLACYEKHRKLMHSVLLWGLFAPMMEVHVPVFSDYLTQVVDKKNREFNAGVSVAEAVAALSSFEGKTESKREQMQLLKLAMRIKNVKNIPAFSSDFKRHAKEFGWIAYNYGGPGWSEKHFAESIVPVMDNAPVLIKQFEQAEAEGVKKRGFFEEKLMLSTKEKKLFAIARDFMKAKALRKEAMSFAGYASEPLHGEIARRLNLSLLQMRLMTLEELKSGLAGKMIVTEQELNQRSSYYVYGVFENGGYTILATGKDAEPFSAAIKEKKINSSISELRGACACPGKASGVVKVVNRPEDVGKMRKGDVLVSISTTPDLVAAMRLASAIVTDSGGLTSHAAIVSRELDVPCIIGTKIATKVLRDGDKVEIDAGKGVVKRV